MGHALLDRLKTADGLPTIPQTAIEIIQITRDPDCSLEELAIIAEGDPALAARILKTVNSPLFGVRNSVGSLDHAVKLLGIRTVKILALSLAMVDALEGDRDTVGGTRFDYRAFWRYALCNASAARLLAERVDQWLKDEAFLAGLLSDIGLLVAFHVDPIAFRKLEDAHQAGRWGYREDELQALGVSHAEISKTLLADWGLPDSICEAIGGHQCETDETASPDETLTRILRVAERLSRAMWYSEVTNEELTAAREFVEQHFSIGSSAFDEVLDHLTENIRETARLFSIDIGDVPVAAELRQEAALRLADLSVQGDLRRHEVEDALRRAQRDARRLEEQLTYALESATTDSVTSLPDRVAFEEHLTSCLKIRKGRDTAIGLIIINLDHLRDVDARRGRAAGDAVLCQAAEDLAAATRPKGTVFQFTEVEFAVVTMGLEVDEIDALTARLKTTVENVSLEDGETARSLEPRVGVAYAKPDDLNATLQSMVEAADEALYRAGNSED